MTAPSFVATWTVYVGTVLLIMGSIYAYNGMSFQSMFIWLIIGVLLVVFSAALFKISEKIGGLFEK